MHHLILRRENQYINMTIVLLPGIDNHREDGIYSAYFTNFTSNGDYHVDMSVKIRKRGRWKRVDDLFTSGAMTPKLSKIRAVTVRSHISV